MTHRIIRNKTDLTDWCKLLEARGFPQTVQSKKGADRSLDQNALQFKWATEAAQQLGDVTTDEVRCRWKLEIGVPIKRQDDDFREIYDLAIKPLTYEQKMVLMRTYPVTSEMRVPQMTEYLDTIQRECAEQGIRLTDPEQQKTA